MRLNLNMLRSESRAYEALYANVAGNSVAVRHPADPLPPANNSHSG